MDPIHPEETRIVGGWILEHGRMLDDAASLRIHELVATHLVKLGHDWSGWGTLYRDPTDGRLWELTYPQGDMQGGGPRTLQVLSEAAARSKYPGVLPT